MKPWGACWLLAGVLAWGQLPATGMKTDVMQTSDGELQIKPLASVSLLLAWGAQEIYVDPLKAANFGGWPKADLILITAADPAHFDADAVVALRKGSTQILAPPAVAAMLSGTSVIPVGSERALTLPASGKPLQARVEAVAHASGRGEGFVLALGSTRVFISGDTACTPQITALRNIAVAFVAINPQKAMAPKVAAACVSQFRPKIVYPYQAEGNGAELFAQTLKPAHGIEVRIRSW